MTLMQILHAIPAMAGILTVLFGSLWLKKQLRRSAVQ